MNFVFEIVFSVAIIGLLFLAVKNRKKEKKEWIKEERDEERGKYWDNSEQDWSSKKEQERFQERREIYQDASVKLLKKQIMTFVYDENPDLVDLDTKGFNQLDAIIAQNAQNILREVEKIKKAVRK